MVTIISDIGFCYGVRNAINELKKAHSKFPILYLNHPLIHNEELNRKLMEDNGSVFYNPKTKLNPLGSVVYSAHGHPLEEEIPFKEIQSFDAICPLIVKRYEFLQKPVKNATYYFLGKKNHQETLGFLSRFPFLVFIDSSLDLLPQLKELRPSGKTFLIPQTTVSQDSFQICSDYLNSKTELLGYLPICQLYSKRTIDAISFLKKVDKKKSYFVVVGDKTSSNANEIYRAIKKSYPALEGKIALKITDFNLKELRGKDIYITSATSVSEEEVKSLLDSFNNCGF